jgi:hypothetical protein
VRTLQPADCPAAFSLTEVVLALGVAAVAFTSLMALFPLGLNLNNESYMETQACILAKTILEDLRDAQGGSKWGRNADSPTKYRLLQISTNANPETNNTFLAIPLSAYTNSYTTFVAYTNATIVNAFGSPTMLRPFKSISALEFTNGVPGAAAVSRIVLNQLLSDLHRVEIAVDVPGSVKETNRTRQSFAGALR